MAGPRARRKPQASTLGSAERKAPGNEGPEGKPAHAESTKRKREGKEAERGVRERRDRRRNAEGAEEAAEEGEKPSPASGGDQVIQVNQVNAVEAVSGPAGIVEAAAGERGGRNKEKVLVLSSRGIVFRYRHLMEDMINLLPHCKKDSKFDMGKGESLTSALCELADLRGCSSCLFFETRKKQDLYLWVAKVPNGPSVKFHVSAVHTMAELKLVGNHLKGSRPLLSFSPAFDRLPHLQLLKELFTQVFGTPKGHRKSKPFFDHIHSFTFLDNHIWFRNFQVVLPGWEGSEGGKLDKPMLEKMTLVEVGPRFCLNPIRIFSRSFGGPTLFENPHFVSPNTIRAEAKRAKSTKYGVKVKAKQRRKEHERENRLEPDELEGVWRE